MLITQKNSKAIFIILIIVLFFSKKICSQEYISPIDYRIKLSGTFGELRNNHFHTGIDLKTGGIEGKNIYSIADGNNYYSVEYIWTILIILKPKSAM